MTEYALAGTQHQERDNHANAIAHAGGQPRGGAISAGGGAAFGDEMEWEREFEDDLIFLVSNLEQMMARLIEEDPLRKPVITAPFFAQMVNQAVTFYEGLPRTTLSAMSLQEELSAAAGIYPMLRSLQVRGNRLALDLATSAADENPARITDRDHTGHEVFQGEILILESYFSFFETFFHSPDAQGRWKEVCKVFIAELKRLATENNGGDAFK